MLELEKETNRESASRKRYPLHRSFDEKEKRYKKKCDCKLFLSMKEEKEEEKEGNIHFMNIL